MKDRFHVIRWVVWGLAALFYLYEFLLRISPSVMIPELMREFNVDAAALGVVSAFYLYAYAPMQIPVGLLMDKFGARKLLTFAALVCGLGGLLFGTAVNIWFADSGRVLMGLGSSFAWIGIAYISASYFPGGRTAILIGLANSFGMLGAIIGEGPLALSVELFGWRATSIGFGVIGIIIAIVIFWVVKGAPPRKDLLHKAGRDPLKMWPSLKQVCRNWQTWLNAVINICIYAIISVLGGLWAVPFLQEAHGYGKAEAGFAASMIFVGSLVGGPVIGHLSDCMGKRKPWLIISSISGCAALIPVIYFPPLPTVWVYVFLGIAGFFGAGCMLNFSLAIEVNDRRSRAMSVGLTNGVTSLGGSLLQPLVGWFLDLGRGADGVYSIADFQAAMTTFPVLLLVGFILSFFLHERPPSTPEKKGREGTTI